MHWTLKARQKCQFALPFPSEQLSFSCHHYNATVWCLSYVYVREERRVFVAYCQNLYRQTRGALLVFNQYNVTNVCLFATPTN